MFDSDLLKQLEYLSLVTRKVFAGRTMAGHNNSIMGGGVEFADHRNYNYGDDLRHLDWNVYARLGSSLIKRFQEDGDLRVYCCLDISKSMGFNVHSKKFTFAKNLIAAFSYISLSRFDTVSAITFSSHFEAQHQPVRGKQHFLSLLKFLEEQNINDGETNFDIFTEDILRRIGTPGLIILVSDFYDRKGLDNMLDRLLFRHFEPVVLQIYDPEEADPNLHGDYCFTDAESGVTRNMTINESSLKKYKLYFKNFVRSIHESCKKRGCVCHSSCTNIPFEQYILETTRKMRTVKS